MQATELHEVVDMRSMDSVQTRWKAKKKLACLGQMCLGQALAWEELHGACLLMLAALYFALRIQVAHLLQLQAVFCEELVEQTEMHPRHLPPRSTWFKTRTNNREKHQVYFEAFCFRLFFKMEEQMKLPMTLPILPLINRVFLPHCVMRIVANEPASGLFFFCFDTLSSIITSTYTVAFSSQTHRGLCMGAEKSLGWHCSPKVRFGRLPYLFSASANGLIHLFDQRLHSTEMDVLPAS